MTNLTKTIRELVVIHDYALRDFVSLKDVQKTLHELSELFMHRIECNDSHLDYSLALFLGWDTPHQLNIEMGPHSQRAKLYRVLCDHLYGIYSLGSIYTLKAVEFRKSGPFLLLSIDTRWKIGTWRC